jgi:hypothetical protein
MLREIEGCVKRRESFAFESTLSGMGYVARSCTLLRASVRVGTPSRNL